MKEYNELTKKLLAEGYTAENYPDYVKIPSGRLSGSDPLHNLYGGFEYLVYYRDEFVYQTPCGFCVMGRNTLDGLCSMGNYYCHENNNVLVRCPHKKKGCAKNAADMLYDTWCQCSRTEEPYDYERSIEKIRDEKHKEKTRKWEEFVESRNGRVCQVHCIYNDNEEWEMHYDPDACIKYCPNSYCRCSVLGKEFSKKRGNVFYDLKKTYENQDYDGKQFSMFDKSQYVSIEKGKRWFPNPMPIEVCEALVKLENGRILQRWMTNNSSAIMFNPTLKVEVLNIRAEIRESRDLMQDLKDIQEGIEITHESDNIARKKEEKSEKRKQAKEKKREGFIKRISTNGWNSLDAQEKVRAGKCLEAAEINKADKEFKAKQKAEKKEPEQFRIEGL